MKPVALPDSPAPDDEVSEKDILLEIYSEMKRVRQLLYFFAGLWFIGVLLMIAGTFSS
jgi:hypothetical protein